jgi:thymidylate kinase
MSPPASKAMTVEFISTPGAGKTTLLPVVNEFFASRGLHARSVLEASRPFTQRTKIGKLVNSWAPASLKGPLLWQVFYHSSRMRRAVFRNENQELLDSVLRFQRTRPISRSDRQHVLRWFINLTGQYHFLKEHARANDVLIFDEGFIHRVVQLFASEAEPPDGIRIRSYLSLIPVPDLIITPQVSLKTCIERVYRRGIWERFKDRDKEVVSRFMTNAHTIVNLAIDYIHTRGWPVIQIINENQHPADSARQLRQKLASLYAPAAEEVFISINA